MLICFIEFLWGKGAGGKGAGANSVQYSQQTDKAHDIQIEM